MWIFSSLVCITLEKLALIRWLFDLVLKHFGETTATNVNTLNKFLSSKIEKAKR